MKRKLSILVMICVLAVGLSACSQTAAEQQSDSADKIEETSTADSAETTSAEDTPAEDTSTDTTEQTVSKEGFSIHEISDDLFIRMKPGILTKKTASFPERIFAICWFSIKIKRAIPTREKWSCIS